MNWSSSFPTNYRGAQVFISGVKRVCERPGLGLAEKTDKVGERLVSVGKACYKNHYRLSLTLPAVQASALLRA